MTTVKQDNRESHMFWTWNDSFNLVHVQALKNTNSNTFWVPSLGWTGTLNINLFENKNDAYLQASKNLISLEQELNTKKKNLAKNS